MAETSKVYSYASAIAQATLSRRFNVQVCGEENIPLEGPCIIAPNHIKLVDPYILLGWVTRRQLSFLNRYDHKATPSLELLEQIRMLGTRALGGVMIDRTEPGSKVTKLWQYLPQPPKRNEAFISLKKKLVEGRAVCIFPQGERNLVQKNLKSGIAYLALDKEIGPIPTIPVGLSDSEKLTMSSVNVQINIGEPFLAIGDAGIKEDRQELLSFLSDSIFSLTRD